MVRSNPSLFARRLASAAFVTSSAALLPFAACSSPNPPPLNNSAPAPTPTPTNSSHPTPPFASDAGADAMAACVPCGGACVDVHDQKVAEQALRESEARLRWLVENTTESIWRFELDRPIPIE